jgi:hypothetical protein
MKSIIPIAALCAGSLFVTSCAHNYGTIPTTLEGFEAFDSPRDFDPPGRVFRVGPDGVQGVGTLDIVPKTGNEYTKKYGSTVNWSLDVILKSTGVAAEKLPAAAQADLSRTHAVSLGSTKAVREYIDDSDQPTKKAEDLVARVGYRKNNKYYVIRETVATSSLDFSSDRKWLADLNLEAVFSQSLSLSNQFKYENDKTFSLVATFDKPMRVWYKVERLVPENGLGVGPNAVPSFTNATVLPGEFRIQSNTPIVDKP